MGKRGRKPKAVVNMATGEEFDSASEAARAADVSLTTMYNHLHMRGRSSINEEQYCYLKIKNLAWLKEQIEKERD